MNADFRIDNHGSIVVLFALTQSAEQWVEDYLPAERQTWGRNGNVVEPRYIVAIVEGIRDAGLEVQS